MVKLCILGELGSVTTETLVDKFSNKFDLSLFVENISDAREMIETTNTNVKVTYNPNDLIYADTFIICIEPKFDLLIQKVDTVKISKSIDMVKRYGREGSLIIIESDMGIGKIRDLFQRSRFHIAYCHSLSNGIQQCEKSKVIGGLTVESKLLATRLYTGVFDIASTTECIEKAEAVVLFEKSFKLVQRAFVNEFADYCDRNDLDIYDIIDTVERNSMKDAPIIPYPCIGSKSNLTVRCLMDNENKWPVLQSAVEQFEKRPREIYERIVGYFCGKDNYDNLHKKKFLVVGLGDELGSSNTSNSPVMDVIHYLIMEGSSVEKFDLFVKEFSTIPELQYNSGRDKFDGIIVFHPYLISKWKQFGNKVIFLCRH